LIAATSCTHKHHVVLASPSEWQYPERLKVALGRNGEDRRVALEGLIHDYDPDVRIVASQNLASIKSESSIDPLIFALQDSSIFVRSAARTGLTGIGTPAIRRLLLSLRSDPLRHSKALALLGILARSSAEDLDTKLVDEALRDTRFVRCVGAFVCERRLLPGFHPSLSRRR